MPDTQRSSKHSHWCSPQVHSDQAPASCHGVTLQSSLQCVHLADWPLAGLCIAAAVCSCSGLATGTAACSCCMLVVEMVPPATAAALAPLGLVKEVWSEGPTSAQHSTAGQGATSRACNKQVCSYCSDQYEGPSQHCVLEHCSNLCC